MIYPNMTQASEMFEASCVTTVYISLNYIEIYTIDCHRLYQCHFTVHIISALEHINLRIKRFTNDVYNNNNKHIQILINLYTIVC